MKTIFALLIATALALASTARADITKFDCASPNDYVQSLIGDVSGVVGMFVPQVSTTPVGNTRLERARPIGSTTSAAMEVVSPGAHAYATLDGVGVVAGLFHGQISESFSPRALANLVLHRFCVQWVDAPPADPNFRASLP